MKITSVEPIQCDAGWASFTFVKVETDAGIMGYGECTDWRMPNALAGGVRDMASIALGQDPMSIEKLCADMTNLAQQAPGGLIQRSIAGIECALWDIKGKAYGVPVYELLGGPYRKAVRVYWSHCGTYRARYSDILGTPPLRSYSDITALGREVVDRGFTALKTNIVVPGDPATTVRTSDGNLRPGGLELIVRNIDAFREGVGDPFDIALDVNFYFKSEPVKRIAHALESKGLMWLEVESFDPKTIKDIRDSTSMTICSGESINTLRYYRPFLESHAMDVAMIDVPWTGLVEAARIASLADANDILVAPHNYYSHLGTYMSLALCAVVPNLRIMETDVDDVPWKDDLITESPEVADGYMTVPNRPGWGADLNEEVARAHPWNP